MRRLVLPMCLFGLVLSLCFWIWRAPWMSATGLGLALAALFTNRIYIDAEFRRRIRELEDRK